MTVRINTAMQNRQADSAVDAFDSGTLAVRTGSQPASANDAASGTLLSTITLPATAFGAAASGTAAKNDTWSDTVDTTGTPGWFRMANSGDTLRIDGAVAASGSDLNISGLVGGELIAGGTLTIDTFTVTQPAS